MRGPGLEASRLGLGHGKGLVDITAEDVAAYYEL